MVLQCVVRGCTSKWYPGCNIKYHSFPKDIERRNLWIAKVPFKNKFYAAARICSIHFDESHYDKFTKRLKATAVPFFIEEQSLVDEIDVEYSLPNMIDKGVQVQIKSSREEILQKRNKSLVQKVSRQKKRIADLNYLLKVVKKYANKTDLENIIQGRFADVCNQLKKPSTNPHGIRYSEEEKAFALTLCFYSPKAYEFLRNYILLPHVETLRRSLSSFKCNVGFSNF